MILMALAFQNKIKGTPFERILKASRFLIIPNVNDIFVENS